MQSIHFKCKDCKYFNRFDKTYIENDGKRDCCAFWHTAYHKWENAGERERDCFSLKVLFDFEDNI